MTLHTGRFHALTFVALIFMLLSCEADKPSYALDNGDKGKVMLSLYSDIEIKSTLLSASDVENYNFRFLGVDGYGSSQYYRYGDVSWPMEWYFGVFRLQAESCTVEEAEDGYGRVRYAGIGEPFSIVNDQLATASVVCNIANFRVAVSFDDKMYMVFKEFKLVVDSMLAPIYEEDEDGNSVLVREEQLLRTLDFTPTDKSGFYNLHEDPILLHYKLYVMLDGASEYIEHVEGYFTEPGFAEPAVVNAGDYITLNVSYSGDVQPTEGIKFIVNGERKSISNSVGIEDYIEDSATEDE